MPPFLPFLILALGFLLSACTPMLQIEAPPSYSPGKASLNAEQPERYWWQLRFKLTWPEGEDPDFSQHLLIAEQIMLPAIIENEAQLPLWRFHRRAGRDGAGHQFSLIVFCDAGIAEEINRGISENPLTQWLVDRSMIEKVSFRQRNPEELGRLELTSDPEWPMEIQRSWPYFIMGASQTWLMLVQELSGAGELVRIAHPTGEVSYDELLAHYRGVDEELNRQWRDFGQHAYLHHLSALFGYQPVRIKRSELQQF